MDTPDSGKFDLGRFVSTVANLGVLVGLLLVAVQISQSTDIARAQLANDYYLADMQAHYANGPELVEGGQLYLFASPKTRRGD